MRSPTLSDVARTAGVSYATADRVVNNRGNVAAKSVRKVNEAVATLGYVRNIAAANLSKRRTYRFVFLLPSGSNAFFARIRHHVGALLEHLAQDRIHVDLLEIDAFEADALEKGLQGLVGQKCDGVAVVGLQTPGIETVLDKMNEQGTAIVSLVSDLPLTHRSAYIGIDNTMAGRTAGRLLGMAHGGQPGTVQVLAGSLEARDHADRFTGFAEVLMRDYPQIDILPLIETRDNASKVSDAVRSALDARPKITAIYNVGAGNSGLVAAMSQMRQPDNCFCVVHELVDHSRKAIESGLIDLIIDQRPDVEVNRALTIMRALSDGQPVPPMPELVPTIYVRDNLPRQDLQEKLKGSEQ